MAAIVPVTGINYNDLITLRTGTAQADTGQTDWVFTPPRATFCIAYFYLTAVAGTTPQATFSVLAADPVTLTDTSTVSLTAGTQVTAAQLQVGSIGPGVTGIADATSASKFSVNTVVPALMGFKLLFDRTTGDETYTYTLRVAYR